MAQHGTVWPAFSCLCCYWCISRAKAATAALELSYITKKGVTNPTKGGASISEEVLLFSSRPKEDRLVGAWWREARRLHARFHSITLSCLFRGRLRLKPISALSFRHSCCLNQGHGHYQQNGSHVDIDEPEISFSASWKSLQCVGFQ